MTEQNPGIVEMKFRITGTSSLLLHDGELGNPLSYKTKTLKPLTSKKQKTEADYGEIARVEFLLGAYINEDKKVIIPGANLVALLIGGAKKSKKGELFKASVFVDQNFLLTFPDMDKTIEELYELRRDEYMYSKMCGINQVKTLRTRPRFKTWSLEFTVSVNTEVVNKDDVYQALVAAGKLCGLGDWTPQHGRFTVEKLEE